MDQLSCNLPENVFVDQMPKSLLIEIGSYFDVRDAVAYMSTCRRIRALRDAIFDSVLQRGLSPVGEPQPVRIPDMKGAEARQTRVWRDETLVRSVNVWQDEASGDLVAVADLYDTVSGQSSAPQLVARLGEEIPTRRVWETVCCGWGDAVALESTRGLLYCNLREQWTALLPNPSISRWLGISNGTAFFMSAPNRMTIWRPSADPEVTELESPLTNGDDRLRRGKDRINWRDRGGYRLIFNSSGWAQVNTDSIGPLVRRESLTDLVPDVDGDLKGAFEDLVPMEDGSLILVTCTSFAPGYPSDRGQSPSPSGTWSVSRRMMNGTPIWSIDEPISCLLGDIPISITTYVNDRFLVWASFVPPLVRGRMVRNYVSRSALDQLVQCWDGLSGRPVATITLRGGDDITVSRGGVTGLRLEYRSYALGRRCRQALLPNP